MNRKLKSKTAKVAVLAITILLTIQIVSAWEWHLGWVGDESGSIHTDSFRTKVTTKFKIEWFIQIGDDETWSFWVDIYKGSFSDSIEHVKAIYQSGTNSDRMGEYSFVSSDINSTEIYLILTILTTRDVHWQIDWYYEYESTDSVTYSDYTTFPIIAISSIIMLVLIRKRKY